MFVQTHQILWNLLTQNKVEHPTNQPSNHVTGSLPDDPEGGGAPALCQMVASAANLRM